MKRLLLALAVGWALFGCVEPASAQRGFRPAPGYRPGFQPNRMPGWDWWRIYPWSPYNYGRNPYNPAYYTYPYPYPYYTPYYDNYYSSQSAPMLSTETNQHVLIPHPTGELRAPPPDAGVIQLRLPDAFADVSFDGEKSSSVGYTRYYVTPVLERGKAYHYEVTASWGQGDQQRTEQRKVDVSPGRTTYVDFTQPAAAR